MWQAILSDIQRLSFRNNHSFVKTIASQQTITEQWLCRRVEREQRNLYKRSANKRFGIIYQTPGDLITAWSYKLQKCDMSLADMESLN